MSQWRNTDRFIDKPNDPYSRTVRPFVTLTTANLTTSGATTIQFNGVGPLTAANLGVTPGMFVTNANSGYLGFVGFFSPNTPNSQIISVTGNLVVLAAATIGNIAQGTNIVIDTQIRYPANTVANTYNRDVIYVSPTRMANNLVNVSKTHTGWMYVLRTQNGDGTVRYRTETLAVLGNNQLVAANSTSANTSWGRIFSGV